MSRTKTALELVWRGPHNDRASAEYQAKLAADRRQVPIRVFAEESADGAGAVVVRYVNTLTTESGPAHAKFLRTVDPDPERAPQERWSVVAIGGHTDRGLRDVQVESWREFSKREALRAGEKKLVPYHIQTRDQQVRLHNHKVAMYSYVVRRNPRFPFEEIPLTKVIA